MNKNKSEQKDEKPQTEKINSKKDVKKESQTKKENIWECIVIAMLFGNLILLISSFWFPYESFYIELIAVSLLLGLSFLLKKYFRKFAIAFGVFFYIFFVFINYNYGFVLGGSIVLGVLGLHFVKPHLEIPHFVYSLLPLFILGHIIWFNVLPFGFEGEWVLDMGSEGDDLKSSDLYIIDERNVLSPRQSYGDKTWREFEKDGSFQVGFNTPVNLANKTVEISMEYEAAGPIYVNGELFYDPAWGSSVNLGDYGGHYIYGADVFNITLPFENTTVQKFLNITGYNSTEEYVLDKYNINLAYKGNYTGLYDYAFEYDEVLSSSSVPFIVGSDYFKNINVTGNVTYEVCGEYTYSGYIETYNLSNLSNLSVGTYIKLLPINTSYIVDANNTIVEFSECRNETSYTLINLSTLESIEELLNTTNTTELSELLITPWEKFLDGRTLVEFMDTELNNGPYPREKPVTDYSSVEEFVRAYYPNGVLMEDFTGEYRELEEEMNSRYIESINSVEYYDDWTDEEHTVNATFRGPIKFYGVFNDSINFSLWKQDQNWYNGSDELIVRVLTFNRTEIFNITFEDDGITEKGPRGNWTKFSFYLPLEQEGIYRIWIEENVGRASDAIHKNMTVNTNKLVTEERFLLWSPTNFYFNSKNDIKVKYWWDNKNQELIFDNNNFFHLEKNDKDKWKSFNLNNYSKINFEKGYTWIDGRNNFGFWRNSLFESELRPKLQISKSVNFQEKNIRIKKIEQLSIKASKKTKISKVNINDINTKE